MGPRRPIAARLGVPARHLRRTSRSSEPSWNSLVLLVFPPSGSVHLSHVVAKRACYRSPDPCGAHPPDHADHVARNRRRGRARGRGWNPPRPLRPSRGVRSPRARRWAPDASLLSEGGAMPPLRRELVGLRYGQLQGPSHAHPGERLPLLRRTDSLASQVTHRSRRTTHPSWGTQSGDELCGESRTPDTGAPSLDLLEQQGCVRRRVGRDRHVRLGSQRKCRNELPGFFGA